MINTQYKLPRHASPGRIQPMGEDPLETPSPDHPARTICIRQAAWPMHAWPRRASSAFGHAPGWRRLSMSPNLSERSTVNCFADADPNFVETSPKLVNASTSLVEAGPKLSETNPNLVETSPKLVEIAPKLTQPEEHWTKLVETSRMLAEAGPNWLNPTQSPST